MNNQITIFQFHGEPVRTVFENEQVYFCGKDICDRLGYQNDSKALGDHCCGVTKRYPIVDSLGRLQEMKFISEPDVWRLICSSHQPVAVELERWIFEEVLPTIRRTGVYVHPTIQPHHPAAPPEITLDAFISAMMVKFPEQVSLSIRIGGKKCGPRTAEQRDDEREKIQCDNTRHVGQFFREFLVKSTDPNAMIPAAEVYSAYYRWCFENGHRPVCSSLFGKHIFKWFRCEKVRSQTGDRRTYFYHGLAWRAGATIAAN